MGLADGKQANVLGAIPRVVVIGGMHGNERTGVHAAQYIKNRALEFACGSVESVEVAFGNPRAIQRNVRYIDRDLNRCFFYDYASPLTAAQVEGRVRGTREYEMGRALSLRSELGALVEPVPMLIDLHTTTANMGASLIVSGEDPWTLDFAARLSQRVPDARILSDGPSPNFQGTSGSLGRRHLTLEMGPIAQGTVDFSAVQRMLAAVKEAIQVVDELNRSELQSLSRAASRADTSTESMSAEASRLEFFRWLPFSIDYPRDEEGMPSVALHPTFVGSDFQQLALDTPVFLGFDGGVIRLRECSDVAPELLDRLRAGAKICPVFVGESAYVEKGLAFLTAEVVTLDRRDALL